MSAKNRKGEYDRLVSLARQADIPQSLKDEFEKKETVKIETKKKGKK